MSEPAATYVYRPGDGHGLAHDPFNAIVGPRPIGWISSCDRDGHCNLAPYSFFNAFNYHPPIIGFASIGRKDTLRNIEQTGEFVWNLATLPLAAAMNASSASVPAAIDEFKLAGLTAAPSLHIQAPRVAESPVNFECRLSQCLQLQSAQGERLASWLILGEVIAVHIDPALIIDGCYDTALAQPLLRGGGAADYFGIDASDKLVIPRPPA